MDEGRWSVAVDAHKRHAELAIRSGVATSSHLSAASRFAHDTWHHLAFVFSREVAGKTEVRVFVDGREDPHTASLPMASDPGPDTALVIGTHLDPKLWQSHGFSNTGNPSNTSTHGVIGVVGFPIDAPPLRLCSDGFFVGR